MAEITAQTFSALGLRVILAADGGLKIQIAMGIDGHFAEQRWLWIKASDAQAFVEWLADRFENYGAQAYPEASR